VAPLVGGSTGTTERTLPVCRDCCLARGNSDDPAALDGQFLPPNPRFAMAGRAHIAIGYDPKLCLSDQEPASFLFASPNSIRR
jgi:hypothetical protein